MICVLEFSANRVWLVSHLVYYFLHYYKARAFSIPTVQSDAVTSPMHLLVTPYFCHFIKNNSITAEIPRHLTKYFLINTQKKFFRDSKLGRGKKS